MRTFLFALLLLMVLPLLPTLPAARAVQPPNQLFLPLVTNPVPVAIVYTKIVSARGGLVAQGELHNHSTQPVYDVELAFTLYDGQGTMVYTKTDRSLLRAIFPGETSAFSFDLRYDLILPGGAREQFTVIGWKTSIAEQIVPLEVLDYDVEINYTFDGMQLEIDLRNPAAVAVQRIDALAWSFPQGSLTRPRVFEEVLPPGGLTTITIYVPQSTRVAGIGIQAQGVVVP